MVQLTDRTNIRGSVIAVLENVKTGKKRFFEAKNLVLDTGDEYYAERGAAETPNFTPAGIRLGITTGIASAPAKGDALLTTTTTATLLSGSEKEFDSGYPKSNDGDPDNTGAGVDIVTYLSSYGTTMANSTNISTLDIPDALSSPIKAVSVANFSAKFEKTSADTLKVFVNHTFSGV